MSKTAFFKTEAELCAAFVAALPKGWTAYNETAGYDILLVREDGLQVGMKAQHPTNWAQIEADFEKWKPSDEVAV